MSPVNAVLAAPAARPHDFRFAQVECPSVFIVAFDDVLRRTLELALRARFIVSTFKNCESFIECGIPEGGACLVVQATTPNAGSLLRRAQCEEKPMPTILIGDRSDVAAAVKAIKAGAADFLETPVRRDALIDSILVAMEQMREATDLNATQFEAAARMATLTVRQHEILGLILEGYPSKNIASDLGISQRTVENHRAEIMKKTGSRSIPALVANVIAANQKNGTRSHCAWTAQAATTMCAISEKRVSRGFAQPEARQLVS